MTPDKKPEWFQLADADNSASIRKISKGLPIMALVAVAAIIGVGVIFAQPQEQTHASATETLAPAVVEATQTSTPVPFPPLTPPTLSPVWILPRSSTYHTQPSRHTIHNMTTSTSMSFTL